jgi:hypothetical protein
MSEPTKQQEERTNARQPAECAKPDYRSYVRVASGKLPPVSHSLLLPQILDTVYNYSRSNWELNVRIAIAPIERRRQGPVLVIQD